MAKNKVEVNGIGYEIKGTQFSQFKRAPAVKQEDLNIDIPNGDLFFGQQKYAKACGGCHNLDFDHGMGPALRTIYLSRTGGRKGFNNY